MMALLGRLGTMHPRGAAVLVFGLFIWLLVVINLTLLLLWLWYDIKLKLRQLDAPLKKK